MKKLNLFLLICIFLSYLFFFSSCKSSASTSFRSNEIKPNGQKAPPDMLFMPGNDSIAPFYFSKTEESNFNYIAYLNWLSNTWGEDFPETVLEALPHGDEKWYNEYFLNPEFALAPVTHLSWKQIENYVIWKTDRLNEAILIELKFLNMNCKQLNGDNFNAEAYIDYQYEGSVRKSFQNDTTGGERNVEISDAILLFGYRLATEAEWDFARKRVNETASYHYDKNYFTLKWIECPLKFDTQYVIPVKKKNILKYDFEDIKNGQIQNSKKTFSNNTDEWLLDAFEENKFAKSDWKEVLKDAGYIMDSSCELRNEQPYFYHKEKDSLGRMQCYRFVGVDESGEAIKSAHHAGSQVVNVDKWSSRILNTEVRERVVKTASGRKSVTETESAGNLGFRLVLPYSGQELKRKYKVRW